MLSTASGFTPNQAERYRSLFYMMLSGVAILLLGVGILCFGRMYVFDSSRYDLFMVFGVIIVTVAAVAITVPVIGQLRLYLEVRRENKELMETDNYAANTVYAPVSYKLQGQQQQQQQQEQQKHRSNMPFSSAAYMMTNQQYQAPPYAYRMGAEVRQFDASVASSETAK